MIKFVSKYKNLFDTLLFTENTRMRYCNAVGGSGMAK